MLNYVCNSVKKNDRYVIYLSVVIVKNAPQGNQVEMTLAFKCSLVGNCLQYLKWVFLIYIFLFLFGHTHIVIIYIK